MALNRFLLDSDILIEHLRGRAQAISFIAGLKQEGELLVSAMTVAELTSGIQNRRDAEAIDTLLRRIEIVPVDEGIAKRGGVIRGQYRQSHGTGLVDAIVAATAERTGAILISFNRRHFPMINNLQVPYQR